MSSYVGIDLAWKATRRTGLAVVDSDGRLEASGVATVDEEIAAWLDRHAPQPAVIAIDAPLVVSNGSGQRRAERLIGRAYGRYGASAHSANRGNPLFDPPRAAVLAARFGWDIDPATPVGTERTLCLEVYPHAALVGLFTLSQRVLYKKGDSRRSGFLQLAGLLESVAELRLRESSRWAELRALIAAPRRGDLTRIEDELDAVLCAHLAWLWHHRRDALSVYGSLEEGYIVAPPPPTHPPLAARARISALEDELVIEVRGVEPGTYATARGDRWAAALRSQTAESDTFAPGHRLELEVNFDLPAATSRNDQWDLDNLLKSTMDALIAPLGRRPGGGSDQADDERIDRIVASKRTARDPSGVGARLVLRRWSAAS